MSIGQEQVSNKLHFSNPDHAKPLEGPTISSLSMAFICQENICPFLSSSLPIVRPVRSREVH